MTSILPYTYTSRMSNLPHKPTQWSDRLALDVALTLEKSGDPLDVVCADHQITTDDLIRFGKDPLFNNRVSELRDEIKEKGLTFKLKARAQAEELLTTSWGLIHSPDVSPSVKADLIKSTVKWGDLEPKKSDTSVEGPTGGVSININLGGETITTQVVAAKEPEPDVIEHDPGV